MTYKRLPNTDLEALHKSLARLHEIPAPAVTKEIRESIELTQKLIDYLELRIEMGMPV